jgi:hypothetical protein
LKKGKKIMKSQAKSKKKFIICFLKFTRRVMGSK